MVGHGALTKDVDEPARMCYAEGGGVNFEPIVDAHRQRSGGGASLVNIAHSTCTQRLLWH